MENSAKVVYCKIFKLTVTKERIFQESLSLREDICVAREWNHREERCQVSNAATGPPDSPLSTEPTETGIAKRGNFRGTP